MRGVTLFLFVTLAGMRLGWLLIEDQLTRGPRERVIDWSLRHGHPQIGTFVQCPWCIGFWVQVVLIAVLDGFGLASFPLVALWPFAVNMVAAPIHHWIDRSTRDA